MDEPIIIYIFELIKRDNTIIWVTSATEKWIFLYFTFFHEAILSCYSFQYVWKMKVKKCPTLKSMSQKEK